MISRRELLSALFALGAGRAVRANAAPAKSAEASPSPLRFGLTPWQT